MKNVLRKTFLQKRDAIPAQAVKEKSAVIIQKLLSLEEVQRAQIIFSYISFKSEVYTHGLIKSLIKSKVVVVPIVTDTQKKTLLLSQLQNWSYVSPGFYGILEPRKEYLKEVPYKDIDVAVVPGVLFDKKCHRIGYGGGYFDRLLKKLTAKKIGLAFDTQIIEAIPREKHDASMDKIITDKRIIQCNKKINNLSKTYKYSQYKETL
jgi:5-formyltetrahydrofolate cyclo-ligase